MEPLLNPGLGVFLGLLLEFGEVELLQTLGDLVPAVSQEGDGGRVKVKLEEQREKLEMLVVENADLKRKAAEYEDHKKQLKSQIKQLQGQMDMKEDYKLQLEKS